MSLTSQALDAVQGTDASWTITVTWPDGYATTDLADCTGIAWSAKRRLTDADADAILGPYTEGAGITVVNATTATVAVADTDWPTVCPPVLAWGLVIKDEQNLLKQVAEGTLIVTMRNPSTTP